MEPERAEVVPAPRLPLHLLTREAPAACVSWLLRTVCFPRAWRRRVWRSSQRMPYFMTRRRGRAGWKARPADQIGYVRGLYWGARRLRCVCRSLPCLKGLS